MNTFLSFIVGFAIGGVTATLVNAHAETYSAPLTHIYNPPQACCDHVADLLPRVEALEKKVKTHDGESGLSADWPTLCHGHTEEVFRRINLLESDVRQIRKQLKIKVK